MSETERPDQFTIVIGGRLLNNLGINMYGSLGKCLVEFAANAYDGDATHVNITLDENAIANARKEIRAAAKKRMAEEARKKLEERAREIAAAKQEGRELLIEVEQPVLSFVEDALPGLTVTIKDDGHGMTPIEVQQKFLALNRNRRTDVSANGLKTEAGHRYVMGRKGIGKLSGFGAAMTMTVVTKRSGEDFATKFTLRQVDLLTAADLAKVPVPAEYILNQPQDDRGTTITLSDLKCDAMKFDRGKLEDELSSAFYPIRPEEFAIRINGTDIDRTPPEYQFIWPANLDEGALGEAECGDDEIGRMSFKYVVRFRKRSLDATRRGAWVYCNNRLAFGPSLFSLNTGMHNFMAHQYMECVVEADQLDRQNVDLISTDRGDLLRDNDLVDAFWFRMTDLMQEAIKQHGKHREAEAEREIDHDPELTNIRRMIDQLAPGQRTAGRQVMKVMIARYGTDSKEFHQIAPLLVQTIGAGEVLVNLIEVASKPKDIEQVLGHLLDLQRIEEGDALKIYRGRKNGIKALRKIAQEGEDNFLSGPRNESGLQQLLKECRWLINPELTSYVTSDEDMTNVITKLAAELGIDAFAPVPARDEEARKRDLKRPDLVFLMGDVGSRPGTVLVVELKAPNLPMEEAHLSQLRRYIRKVEEWLHVQYRSSDYKPRVRGVLIGAMPKPDTKAEGQRDLLDAIDKAGINSPWEVIGLNELLERTSRIHHEMVEAFLKHAAEEGEGDAPAMLAAAE